MLGLPLMVRTLESSKDLQLIGCRMLTSVRSKALMGRPGQVPPTLAGKPPSAIRRPLVTGHHQVSEGLWGKEEWWRSSGYEVEC